MSNKTKPETKLWTRNFTLICMINFLIFVNHIMLLSTFPLFIGNLGGSDAVAGAITALFCLVAVVGRPFIGWLTDTKGRRIVLYAGIIGMALLPIGYAAFSVLSVVFVLRMIQGAFLSCSNTSCSTIASDAIPRARFAEGMGMFGMSSALATAGAPALGLFLIERSGYQTLFITAAISMTAALILSFSLKTKEPAAVKKSLDLKGLIDGNALPASLVLLVFLLTFGAVEAFVAKFAMESDLPGGGIFFAVMAVVTVISRITTGKLADQKGEAIFVYTCNASMLAAMLLLGCVPGTVTYLIAAVLAGYGFGGISPVLQAMAVHTAEPSRRGAANSTFLCAYDIGIGFGAGIAGILITVYGYGTMFTVLSAANVISVFCYYMFGRNHKSSFSCAIRMQNKGLDEITGEG